MSLISIILFFVYTWGFGFTVTALFNLFKESSNIAERNIMSVGVGMAVFVVVGVILNALHIMLDWRIFLGLSLLYPIICLIKKMISSGFTKAEKLGNSWKQKLKNINFRLSKSNLAIIVALLIFFVSLYMYAGGAFSYPYLEDDDPWAHALATKYVSLEKTAYQPPNFDIHYIDPYPPGYQILMGVLHQTSESVSWTLKFFNGLIISLAILFFYFFALSFTGDWRKALLATFVLAALPSFFTHFIWAHTLVIMFLFPALYCLEKIKGNKKWTYAAIIAVAAIPLTHSSEAIKISLMLVIYLVVKSVLARKINWHIVASLLGGFLLSGVWWFVKGTQLLGQTATKLTTKGIVSEAPTSFLGRVQMFFLPESGSASRVYSFSDFFTAKSTGLINVQVGWGIFVTLLVIVALLFFILKYKDSWQRKNEWKIITFCWFIFAFLGTNSMTFNLPVGLFAFRFWLLLAVPVALLATMGVFYLVSAGKKVALPGVIILVIVILGIFFTSGYQKFQHNTSPNWPPGVKWTSMEELQGYVWLQENVPANTKVFKYSKPIFIFGLDQYSCEWCPDTMEFRKEILYTDVAELHSWLKMRNYEYLTIGGMDFKYVAREFGENETSELLPQRINEIQGSTLFGVAHQTEGMVVFKVV